MDSTPMYNMDHGPCTLPMTPNDTPMLSTSVIDSEKPTPQAMTTTKDANPKTPFI